MNRLIEMLGVYCTIFTSIVPTNDNFRLKKVIRSAIKIFSWL